MKKKVLLFFDGILAVVILIGLVALVRVWVDKDSPPEQTVQLLQPEKETQQTEAVSDTVVEEQVPVILEEETPITEEVPREAEEDITETELQRCLEEFYLNQNGEWSILVETLDGSLRAEVQADTKMISASLIKLFVMATAYEQMEQGQLSKEEVSSYIEPMITVSDNYSTNQLIRLLGDGEAQKGMSAVNDYAASLGCKNTQLNRLMLEDNGLQNYTSAADCGILLQKIAAKTCVSEEASSEMLNILTDQTLRSRIPAGLPEDAVCGNKTGDLIGLCCADVGFVLSDQGSYVICLICNQQTSDVQVTAAMSELSKAVYEMLTGSLTCTE